jgi:hypothetical protein
MIKLMEYLAKIPFVLDRKFRWFDLRFFRNDVEGLRKKLKLAEGYSGIPVWMPIPLLAFLFYGPLIFDRWRGAWPAIGLGAAILIHLFSCRVFRGLWLALAQWVILAGTSLILYLVAEDTARQVDPKLYPHILLVFVLLVTTLGLPLNRLWGDLLFQKKRQEYRDSFLKNLKNIQLFVKPVTPHIEVSRFLRAFFLALLLTPFILVYPSAFAALFLDSGRYWYLLVIILVFSWVVLAAVHYNKRLTALLYLIKRGFFTGGTRILSLLVIVLAVTRLFGVSYVTTVLDGASRWTIIALLACLYLTMWLYDFWTQRALSEVLLGLLDTKKEHPSKVKYDYLKGDTTVSGAIQIHGGGRFLAVVPYDPPKKPDKFQAYQPIDLFRTISRQLLGRARTAHTDGNEDRWETANVAEQHLETLEQRVTMYHTIPAILLVAVLAVMTYSVFNMTQQPGLTIQQEPLKGSSRVVSLYKEIQSRKDGGPVLAIAASGGGTRAALYAYSLLREIQHRRMLDRVVMLSGVSGGSAGIAYFAAHRGSLSDKGIPWQHYRSAMAEPYIRDVLAGAAEKRFLHGTRLGKLLTESFERRFLDGALTDTAGATGEKIGKDQATLGYVAENWGIGLIFNTAVVGSFDGQDPIQAKCLETCGRMRKCATISTAGSRLALTNIAAMTEKSVSSITDGWNIDMPYSIHHDPTIPLPTAASLSANFPPVFSNAAVAFERNGLKNRYYVTDGGAVENRALISLLLALRASISNQPVSDTPLPLVKILVADASAFSEGYKEDRGVGALGGAKAMIASKLIGELAREIDGAYRNLSGKRPAEGPDSRPGVEIVYLSMPKVLRISSAFGTHWMMPENIEIRDPATPYLKPKCWYRPNGCPVENLSKQELLKAIDLLFASNEERNAGSTDAMRKLFEWFGMDDPRDVLDQALRERL